MCCLLFHKLRCLCKTEWASFQEFPGTNLCLRYMYILPQNGKMPKGKKEAILIYCSLEGFGTRTQIRFSLKSRNWNCENVKTVTGQSSESFMGTINSEITGLGSHCSVSHRFCLRLSLRNNQVSSFLISMQISATTFSDEHKTKSDPR